MTGVQSPTHFRTQQQGSRNTFHQPGHMIGLRAGPIASAIDMTAVAPGAAAEQSRRPPERKPQADDDPAVPGQDKISLLALEVL
ncbi:hypothetical protein ACFOLJ_10610 [Rugamonas sp. CCM 8940]|uniref:hypothetical protein n=1 Tax=Rugamonas sp. CCM 8940 TaxID=2765359 RepID=UPI0018F50768|nr:hypothetical protein [Rugamonas sp. CCM 8940]MBJ7309798.1 hypothetical protein [Rugamonas sp. CCM 8940]